VGNVTRLGNDRAAGANATALSGQRVKNRLTTTNGTFDRFLFELDCDGVRRPLDKLKLPVFAHVRFMADVNSELVWNLVVF
jgi:hypothetical protein